MEKSKIFKKGYKFKLKKLDINNPKTKKIINDCLLEQQKIQERKESGMRYPSWL